jgi:hypothetical protein
MGRRLGVAGAVAVAVAVLLAAGGCGSSPGSEGEASVTSCTPGADGGKPVAEGQVTNGSSKTSTYSVRIGFYDDSGNKVTDGVDVVSGVEPATSSPWRVTGLGSMNGAVTCKVAGVTRNADPGR